MLRVCVHHTLGSNLGARRLAAIMFTDIAGYTILTQRNEPLALSLLEKQNEIVLPLIRAHGGTPIKTIGDAQLAEFDSALAAVNCAVEIQRRLREYSMSSSPEQDFKLRIGIHVGDVVHKENDVFGDSVNIASRLEPIAEPGGICISQQVYDQIHNKVEYKIKKLPTQQLKNVSSRIEMYSVSEVESPRSRVSEQDAPKERVAVLPLSNFSPSQQDEYLADGMTEELITAISGVQGLRVIARTSVMKFKNTSVDIAEIGNALRVGTILEGSFRKVGDRIRVTVQLIDAKSEEHIWASNYDGNMEDIFSIQTDIANKVAEALKVKLLTQSVSVQKPVDIDAYEDYLKGRAFWNRRTSDGIMQALKLFESAVKKDPGFAKAYSGIADCYMVGRQFQLFIGEAEARAEEAVRHALKLDDDIAETHASHGLLLTHNFRFAEAEAEFKKALALNPSYATAHHWYALCLANMGRLEEATKEALLASQADPLAPPSKNILGVMYTYARQFDKAMEVFNDILNLDPTFRPALGFRSNIFAYRGMENESMKDLENSLVGASEFEKCSTYAYEAAWFGHKELAKDYFDKALNLAPSEEAGITLRVAFFGLLGEPDEFFKWVASGLKTKEVTPELLRYSPWLDKVNKDPRYAELIKGLPS